MGRFNWVELKALVVSIVESLSEDPPPEFRDRGTTWVAAGTVRNLLLGAWGPQVDEAEFDILVDELAEQGLLERAPGLSNPSTGWIQTLLRPPSRARTERVPGVEATG